MPASWVFPFIVMPALMLLFCSLSVFMVLLNLHQGDPLSGQLFSLAGLWVTVRFTWAGWRNMEKHKAPLRFRLCTYTGFRGAQLLAGVATVGWLLHAIGRAVA